MAAGSTPRRRSLCISVHQIEKAADIFDLRPPGKKLNAYEIHQPRCSESSRSGGSPRIKTPVPLEEQKTVADQIQKCAKAVAADHTGTGFAIRRPSALRRRHVHFGKLTAIFAMSDSSRMAFSASA